MNKAFKGTWTYARLQIWKNLWDSSNERFEKVIEKLPNIAYFYQDYKRISPKPNKV